MKQLEAIWSTILPQEGSGADFDSINMSTWTTTTQVCASIVHMYTCLIPIMLECISHMTCRTHKRSKSLLLVGLPNKRILFTYTHVHVSHTWLKPLQAWQSMLPLLVSSASFHWFDHMYLHERGTEIGRERDSEKEK